MQRLLLFVAVLILGAALVACAPIQPETTPDSASGQAGPPSDGARAETTALTADQLRNGSYSGIYDEPVTLTGGAYEGEPYVAGSASRPTVDYVDGAEQFGDLDGDGVDDAVVFLVEQGGGSGNFVYVAAQLNRDGQAVDAGAVLIEDRVQVRSVVIEGGQVLLDLVVAGPGDGACCPSYKTSKSYALQEGQLAETPGETPELVKVAAADLNGTEWTLAELGEGQPALADTEVTVRFDEGQISGSAGCNNYTAGFALGDDNPFVMTVGPAAATRMACPDPILNQETAYLAALEKTSQWSYWFGKLAFYYAGDQEAVSRLLFEPAVESAQTEMLSGRTWQWLGYVGPVEAFEIDAPDLYTATFDDDGTLAVKADCNLAAGDYTAEDGSMQIQMGPMTLALCGPDSRSEQFVALLGSAARYFFQDGHLFIDLLADGGTLELRPVP